MGFILVAGILFRLIAPVGADASSGWISSPDPQLNKLTDLTPNISPGISNRDCTQQTYTAVNPQTGASSTATDCFADSTLGQMGLSGSPVLFNGTTKALQVNPNYPYLIQPVPNQGMMLALTSASVTGSYMHFYTDIRQYLTPNYAYALGPLTSYTVNHAPDTHLRDKNGAGIVTNPIGTLSYSSNGAWMLVDSPGGSFLRINLATFDVVPFATSLNAPGDYTNQYAATAISDDGRYAAVASNYHDFFRVYDLSTCTGATNNAYTQPLNCQSRDYWSWINGSLSRFNSIDSVRFINDDNISLTAEYDRQSPSIFDVSKFTFTAPGKQPHGLDYLALGDSYISGEGEFQYKAGTDTENNKCHQSPLSYPFIIGSDLFNQYNSIACSGAKTKDVIGLPKGNYDTAPGGAQWGGKTDPSYNQEILTNFEPGYRTQLSFIQKYQPRVVTLSIGGNDIGFANIVTKCVEEALPPGALKKDCYDSYADRATLVQAVDTAYPKLVQTYRKILQADPGVQLYVIGYPQVIAQNPGQCGENVRLTDTDINFAQRLIDFLDTTIEQAAASAGARYVDVQDALLGHRLCEAKASSLAVNGVTAGNDSGMFGINFIGKESFHPDVLGHQLLAQAIMNRTDHLRQAMPAADTSIKPPTLSDAIAAAFLGGYYAPVNFVLPSNVEVADDAIASSTVRGATFTASFDASHYGLAPNKNYQLNMTSLSGTTTPLGTYKTDASGNLYVSATIPATTDVGLQTMSITGTNVAGESTELYADVYIGASSTDMNGDGVDDSAEQCFLIPTNGTDSDNDGIDDACDPVIGDAPKQGYPVTVRLTGNAILIGN